jgi:hypothetical protein
MGKKSKQKVPTLAANDPRVPLLGRYLGVPTSFFDVMVEGARYLGKVDSPEGTTMVWISYPGYSLWRTSSGSGRARLSTTTSTATRSSERAARRPPRTR